MARVLLVVPTSSLSRQPTSSRRPRLWGWRWRSLPRRNSPCWGGSVREDRLLGPCRRRRRPRRPGGHHQHRCDRPGRRCRSGHRRPRLRGTRSAPQPARRRARPRVTRRPCVWRWHAERSRNPPSRRWRTGQDPGLVAGSLGFPLVVKPLSLSGSRGVIKVESPDRLAPVIQRVRGIAAEAGEDGGRVLLEQFVPGPEVAVEGMLWSGDARDPGDLRQARSSRRSLLRRDHLRDAFSTRSGIQDEVARVTQAAVTAIGLREGPIHAELRVDGRQAFGDRGRGPIHRRHVWAGARLRLARHLTRDLDPSPRPRSTTPRPPSDGRSERGDDASDRGLGDTRRGGGSR